MSPEDFGDMVRKEERENQFLGKHTPGPWRLDRDNWNVYSSGMVAQTYGHHHNGEKQANAHLIAAAPELLELAKDYASLFDTYQMQGMTPDQLKPELDPDVFDDVMGRCAQIALVIAKAEGRES